MAIKYAVEVCNKYHDHLVEQIATFDDYEEAENYIRETDIDIDKDSEYFEITEIEDDDYEDAEDWLQHEWNRPDED